MGLDYASRRIAIVLRAVPIAVALAAFAPVAPAQDVGKPSVVADGLDNPRGLLAAPDGSIYFAEAGRAGKTCIEDGCAGFSSSIGAIAPDGAVGAVGAGLLSLGGKDGTFATGADDVAVAADGAVYTVVTSVGPTVPKGLPRSVATKIRAQSGRVVRIDAGGKLTPLAKIDKLEPKKDADKRGKESNPYGIAAASDGKLYVVDAAANTLVEVTGKTAKVIAVFPRATKRADSVPTVVREGPDGALYVGELSGDAAPNGKLRVWRVVPGRKPVVFARGFSRITGIAFSADRSMYVSEFSLNFAKLSSKGDVVRVKPETARGSWHRHRQAGRSPRAWPSAETGRSTWPTGACSRTGRPRRAGSRAGTDRSCASLPRAA